MERERKEGGREKVRERGRRGREREKREAETEEINWKPSMIDANTQEVRLGSAVR
jgi:hypothetical protein